MKHFLLFVATMFLILTVSVAQYSYDPSFPVVGLKADSALIGIGNGFHGIAVDPAGKIWVITYNAYYPGDSVLVAGKNVACQAIRVFLPNGQPASFSPLMILSGNGVTDTLLKTANNTGRGLGTDAKGNILFTWFNMIYQLNWQTGAVIRKITVPQAVSCTKAAGDLNGNIYIATVANNTGPLRIFDNTGAVVGNVTDTTRSYSRDVECSRAGDAVYFAGYTTPSTAPVGQWGPAVLRFSGDPLSGFTVDTMLKSFACEAICRHAQTDKLWACAGSGADVPNQYVGAGTSYTKFTHYLYNPATKKIEDSVKWNGLNTWTGTDSTSVKPRGIATTITGDTLYMCMFTAKAGMYSVQRFKKGANSVRQEGNVIPDNYSLSQNYPNPFNPTTKINFSLKTAGDISLKVFDVLGKEVATLATGHYAAGSYSVEFTAHNVSSGMYFYTLTAANGFHQTQKMILMK